MPRRKACKMNSLHCTKTRQHQLLRNLGASQMPLPDLSGFMNTARRTTAPLQYWSPPSYTSPRDMPTPKYTSPPSIVPDTFSSSSAFSKCLHADATTTSSVQRAKTLTEYNTVLRSDERLETPRPSKTEPAECPATIDKTPDTSKIFKMAGHINPYASWINGWPTRFIDDNTFPSVRSYLCRNDGRDRTGRRCDRVPYDAHRISCLCMEPRDGIRVCRFNKP